MATDVHVECNSMWHQAHAVEIGTRRDDGAQCSTHFNHDPGVILASHDFGAVRQQQWFGCRHTGTRDITAGHAPALLRWFRHQGHGKGN